MDDTWIQLVDCRDSCFYLRIFFYCLTVARQVYAEKTIMVITVMMTRKYDGNNQLQGLTLR